jgi:uncharacterized protein YkwD
MRTVVKRLFVNRLIAAAIPATLLGLVLTASPAQAAVRSTGSLEVEAVTVTNQMRHKYGCKAVRTDAKLTAAARRHSTDMVRKNFFSHTSSDGSNFVTRVKRAGYTQPASENIAWGQATGKDVVNAWLNSPGHRKNLLNCSVKAVGIGVIRRADGRVYWTQDFGRY